VDLDENFVRLERRPGNISEHDLIWSAIAFEDKCFHVSFSGLRFMRS